MISIIVSVQIKLVSKPPKSLISFKVSFWLTWIGEDRGRKESLSLLTEDEETIK